MKKMMKVLLLALLLGATVLALAACGHEHEYDAAWSSDGSHHWHNYTCEHDADERVPVSGLAVHTLSDPATVAASCTATGKETRTCTVCGYKIETTLAASGHSYDNNIRGYVVEGNALYDALYCDACGAAIKTLVPNSVIVTPATAQEALDNAAEGATIYFTAGEYGTLLFRTVKELSTMTPNTAWAGGSGVIYVREFKDITLAAAADATFDGFDCEADTHTPTANIHSLYPTEYLIAGVSLNNVTLRGLTFTGAANAVDLCGHVSVDGLTLDGCKMTDADKDSRLLFRSGAATHLVGDNGAVALDGVMKSITVKGCTVDGAHQVMELRGTENLMVEGNSFKNIAKHTILLAVDGTNYTGIITVTNNTADTISERFFRMAGVGENATVTVTDNTVTNYNGEDDDVIKIELADGATNVNVTVENNTLPDGKTVTVPTAE